MSNTKPVANSLLSLQQPIRRGLICGYTHAPGALKKEDVMLMQCIRSSAVAPAVEMLERRTFLSADIVLEWNNHAIETVRADRTHGGPTWASRNFAIVQAAVFDTVAAIDHSYSPLLVHQDAAKGASMDAAVASAAAEALIRLYPLQAKDIKHDLKKSLAAIKDGKAEKAGEEIGQSVADAIVDLRAGDGSDASITYTPDGQPGHWSADPMNPTQTALGVGWGSVTPFFMTGGAQFRPPHPPAMTSSDYTEAFNEVKSLGELHSATRTAAQTEAGIFWAYDRASMGTPVAIYNQVVQTLSKQKHLSEAETAKLLALVNVAMADSGIAAWDCKYTDNFWRPITAIRNADLDGNPDTTADPGWTPLGAPGGGEIPDFTPPFPAYVSGHSTFGAATFQILANYFGTDNISFDVKSDELPGVTHHFNHFSDAATENGRSRIYLGIHWKFDDQFGQQTGRAIANFVFGKVASSTSLAMASGKSADLFSSTRFGSWNDLLDA